MRLLKFYLHLLQRIAPGRAVDLLYRLMSNPRVRKLRDSEEEVLATASQADVAFGAHTLRRYEWGKGQPRRALLIHGWEGQAGNFAGLVPLLLERGYHILTFDAPAHGKSSRGRTYMFEFGEFLTAQVEAFRPEVIISHSFGSVNTAVALQPIPHTPLRLWVMATTPHRFRTRFEELVAFFGILPKVQARLLDRIEAEVKQPIDDLDLAQYAAAFTAIDRVVIVHPVRDRILSIGGARQVHAALPQSVMHELEGVGHYSILWSEELETIVREALPVA